MANLVILEPAQRELEEIAQLHLNLVGANSARNITNLILDSRLELFPLLILFHPAIWKDSFESHRKKKQKA